MYSFNGTTSNVSAINSSSLSGWTQFSIETWAFIPLATTARMMAMKGTGSGPTNDGWYFYTTLGAGNTYVGLCVFDALRSGKSKSAVVTPNSWYHIVSTFNGSGIDLYINGTKQGSTASCTGHSPANSQNLFIGRSSNTADNYFNSYMGSFKLYNTPLSSTDILSSYQATSGLYTAPPTIISAASSSVIKETTLTITSSASGGTLPYTFSLSGAPYGASITSGGTLTWMPLVSQAPSAYSFNVVVTDAAKLSSYQTTEVTVSPKSFVANTGNLSSVRWNTFPWYLTGDSPTASSLLVTGLDHNGISKQLVELRKTAAGSTSFDFNQQITDIPYGSQVEMSYWIKPNFAIGGSWSFYYIVPWLGEHSGSHASQLINTPTIAGSGDWQHVTWSSYFSYNTTDSATGLSGGYMSVPLSNERLSAEGYTPKHYFKIRFNSTTIGSALIDDVQLRVTDPQGGQLLPGDPAFLASLPYNNRIYTDEPSSIFVRAFIQSNTIQPSTLNFGIALRNTSSSAIITSATTSIVNGLNYIDIELNTDGIVPSTYLLDTYIYRLSTGDIVSSYDGSEKRYLRTLEYKLQSREHFSIDRHGRVLKDGALYFPLTMWISTDHAQFPVSSIVPQLQQLKDSGFNAVHDYFSRYPSSSTGEGLSGIQKRLDNCATVGLDYLFCLNGASPLSIYPGPSNQSTFTDSSCGVNWTTADQVASGMIKTFKDHPALMGYMMYEEPESTDEVAFCKDRYNFIKERDKDHFVFIDHCYRERTSDRNFMDMDAAGFTAYPYYYYYTGNITSESSAYVPHFNRSYLEHQARTNWLLNKPNISVLESYESPMNLRAKDYIFQAYMALITGARGIDWFRYSNLSDYQRLALCAAASAVSKATSAAIGLDSTSVIVSSVNPDVKTLVRELNGKTYVLAANGNQDNILWGRFDADTGLYNCLRKHDLNVGDIIQFNKELSGAVKAYLASPAVTGDVRREEPYVVVSTPTTSTFTVSSSAGSSLWPNVKTFTAVERLRVGGTDTLSSVTFQIHGKNVGSVRVLYGPANDTLNNITFSERILTVTNSSFTDTFADLSAKSYELLDPTNELSLNPIGNKNVLEGNTLSFTLSASGGMSPYTFSMTGAPSGATLSGTGQFSWVPSETQGPSTYTVYFKVVDSSGVGEPVGGAAVSAIAFATLGVGAPTNIRASLDTVITGDEFTSWKVPPANMVSSGTVTVLSGAADRLVFKGDTHGEWYVLTTPVTSSRVGQYFDTVTIPITANTWNGYTFTSSASALAYYSGGGGSDDESIIITVDEDNTAPVLSGIGNKSVNELETLTFTATAIDLDLPPQTLTFSLSGHPAGAYINPSTGAFSWTPTESQAPSTYYFNVIVTDTYGASDMENISVTVNEVNTAPVINSIPSKSVNEGTLLSFSASATDSDIPAQTLSFYLSGNVPSGAGITTAGDFTWTPSETQGPSSYNFRVMVVDNGTPPLSAWTPLSITVGEVNTAPVLNTIGNKGVVEGQTLTFTASAVDYDIPPQTITYTLSGAPSGASIDPSTGVFTWTPSEAQGPGGYSFGVYASDGSLYDYEIITVGVTEANLLPYIGNVPSYAEIDVGEYYTFTATASDADLPPQTLTFSLTGAPAEATIGSANGVFEWTPGEAYSGGTYNFSVHVSDGTSSVSSGTTIYVTPMFINTPPRLGTIGNKSVDEGTLLSFTATATDEDVPTQTLTFSLVNNPSGAVINPTTGAFTWTPTEEQGGSDYTFTVVVTDSYGATDSESITVTVNKIQSSPVLAAIGDKSVNELSLLTFTASAIDYDLPVDTLTFLLIGAPSGAAIDPSTGVFTWTPSESQAPSSYDMTITVNDGGLTDSETITVTVSEVNNPPILSPIGNRTVNELETLTLTASAIDPNIPTRNLVFSLLGEPTGASITTGGAFSWTPTEYQGPGDYRFSVVVTNDGTPPQSDSESILVSVAEVSTSGDLWVADPPFANPKRKKLKYLKEETIALSGIVQTVLKPTVIVNQAELDRKDMVDSLIAEYLQITELSDNIAATISDAPVPTENIDLLGNSITTSDYMKSLGSTSYGAAIAKEIFENYHSLGNPECNEGALLLGVLEDAKHEVLGAINYLESDFVIELYDPSAPINLKESSESINPYESAGGQNQLQKDSYELAKMSRDNASRLRRDVEEAVGIAKRELSRCAVRNLLVGSGATGRSSIEKLIRQLKSIRAALLSYYMLSSMDWKNAAAYVKSYISNRMIDLAIEDILQVYCKSVQRIMDPVYEYMGELNNLTQCNAFYGFIAIIDNVSSELFNKYETTLTDFAQKKKTRTELLLNQNKKTKALISARRWIPLIDAAIIALEGLAADGYIDEDAINRVLSYSNAVELPLSKVPLDRLPGVEVDLSYQSSSRYYTSNVLTMSQLLSGSLVDPEVKEKLNDIASAQEHAKAQEINQKVAQNRDIVIPESKAEAEKTRALGQGMPLGKDLTQKLELYNAGVLPIWELDNALHEDNETIYWKP